MASAGCSALETAFVAARFSATARGVLNCFGFRARAPDDEQFSDVLYRRCAELFADRSQILFAYGPVIVEDTDFDQFMAFKADADFLQH